MKVQLRSASVQLFIASFLIGSAEAFAGPPPPPGLYENSTNAQIVNMLDSASKTIDIEIYQMDDTIVQRAVLSALTDHVQVRIIQEPSPVGDPCKIFEDLNTALDDARCTLLKTFRAKVVNAGGTYLPFSKRLCGGATTGCVEHGKMILIDGNAALISTGNFNSTNLCNKAEHPKNCDRDYTYISHSLPSIQVLGQIFERDLNGSPYDMSTILNRSGADALTVSPFSLKPLTAFISSAKSTIDIQEQYLKDPEMNAALLTAVKSGVKVRINVASACYFGHPSANDVKKWNATYSEFENAGAEIRIFTRHVDVGGVPGYLHAKAIIIDGKAAWIGSVNGSTQSLGSNREYGIFFNNPRDVSTLSKFMQSDFNNPNAESWQDSIICRNDAI